MILRIGIREIQFKFNFKFIKRMFFQIKNRRELHVYLN